MNAIALNANTWQKKLWGGSKSFVSSAIFFPLFLLALSLLFPGLRQTPSLAGIQTIPVLLPLFAQFVIGVVWLVFEYRFVANHETPTRALRRDAGMSHLMGYILGGLVVWSYVDGWLMWAFLVPAIATITDGFLTSDQAISNAAQKPLMQTTKGG